MSMEGVTRLLKSFEIIRICIVWNLPLQRMDLFLHVATNPGITMPELEKKMGESQTSISRHVRGLSRYFQRGKTEEEIKAAPQTRPESKVGRLRGYGLLRTEPDLYDPKCKAVFLTPKGVALAKALDGVIMGNYEKELDVAELAKRMAALPDK